MSTTKIIHRGQIYSVVYKTRNGFAEREFTSLAIATLFKKSIDGKFFLFEDDVNSRVELIS